MTGGSYGQFCPVAMAAEILCTRWTIIVVRELVAGSTRFNELRRGAPRMSPALLSKRLKELEAYGIVERRPVPGEPGVTEYLLTAPGKDLGPVVEALGVWGQRWTGTQPQLENLDVDLLMWDMRRTIRVPELPPKRHVIQFIYPERRPAERNWWIVVDPREGVDLCMIEPGYDIDLFVQTDLRTMTAIWMGMDSVTKAVREDRMVLTGTKALQKNMLKWLGLSQLSGVPKQVA